MPDRPSLFSLWQQAGGGTDAYDPQRYRELAREHGHIMQPGDEGYEQGVRVLSCGWPHSHDPDSQHRQICPSCQTDDHCTGGISFCECECTSGHMPAGMPVSKEGEDG
jgi:hypothetical protein